MTHVNLYNVFLEQMIVQKNKEIDDRSVDKYTHTSPHPHMKQG